MNIVTRFAPSPTGDLHLGGVRTAIFNWAFARKNKGRFILRIENTDIDRSSNEHTKGILDGLDWLGIDYDEGPVYQTSRLERYTQVIEKLLAAGDAYYCDCSKNRLDKIREEQINKGIKPRYDGKCRTNKELIRSKKNGVDSVVRFKNPRQGVVEWNDLVKGRIVISNAELDDLVLLRSNGLPTYNFASVIDDLDMCISHVIRGDDHINNTPRQINLISALNGKLPNFGHLSMIHGPDGQKLSKRHGSTSVLQFRENGFLPEGMLNYLARLGWGFEDKEFFNTEQFIEMFSIEGCGPSPAKFDIEKLRWVNGKHLQRLTKYARSEYVLQHKGWNIKQFEKRGIDFVELCRLLGERVCTINEIAEAIEPYVNSDRIIRKEDLFTHEVYNKQNFESVELFNKLIQNFLENLPSVWEKETLNLYFKATVKAWKIKLPQLAIPIRWILLGKFESPAIDEVLVALGEQEVKVRLEQFLAEEKHER